MSDATPPLDPESAALWASLQAADDAAFLATDQRVEGNVLASVMTADFTGTAEGRRLGDWPGAVRALLTAAALFMQRQGLPSTEATAIAADMVRRVYDGTVGVSIQVIGDGPTPPPR